MNDRSLDLAEVRRFAKEFFYLSNFYPCPVVYREREYLSAEAAFQAQKVADRDREPFTTMTPEDAKAAGRAVVAYNDWDVRRVRVMRHVLRAKFSDPRNEDIRKKLIDTGSALLVEGNTWGDTYWGIYKGFGMNVLGVLLMLVRSELSITKTKKIRAKKGRK